MSVLWPRLPEASAAAIYDNLAISGLVSDPAIQHAAQIFAATGGRRANDDDVRAVRNLIVEAAARHGFPSSDDPRQLISFDRDLAPKLVGRMGVVPAEAASKSVWSFLALVVAPDVTMWRFGAQNRERWICTDLTRHMFSRLWWQAYLLTNPTSEGRDTSILDQLNESELNQLLERTRLGGNRELVQAVARAVLGAPDDVARRDLIREVSLRTLRRMAHTEYSALDEAQLGAEIDRTLQQVIEALRMG